MYLCVNPVFWFAINCKLYSATIDYGVGDEVSANTSTDWETVDPKDKKNITMTIFDRILLNGRVCRTSLM